LCSAMEPELALGPVEGAGPLLFDNDCRRWITGEELLQIALHRGISWLWVGFLADDGQEHLSATCRLGLALVLGDEVVVPPKRIRALLDATAPSWSFGSSFLIWRRFWRPFGSFREINNDSLCEMTPPPQKSVFCFYWRHIS
jgi:hypothetical protein